MFKKHQNELPIYVNFGKTAFLKSFSRIFASNANKSAQCKIPKQPLPVVDFDPSTIPDDLQTKIVWCGHSTVYIELAGKRLLLDPNFSDSPFPLIPRFGGSRFSGRLPFDPMQLPEIDIVILSHNHFDHLDKTSIKLLSNRTKTFCCPTGVGSRLSSWGVNPENIIELKWGQSATIADIQMSCTPARHFSGRYLLDRDCTLWCSWVISGADRKLFFSGDSGYSPHFARIGDKYGPFDIALMECGQYDNRWPVSHMKPEESVQACLDINCPIMLPIHWAGFGMGAEHPWQEPADRALAAARQNGITLCTPRIGEPVILGTKLPLERWWQKLD
ncbi:MAG: MBL fold metallo-hydrolase [Bacillota bacterium]